MYDYILIRPDTFLNSASTSHGALAADRTILSFYAAPYYIAARNRGSVGAKLQSNLSFVNFYVSVGDITGVLLYID